MEPVQRIAIKQTKVRLIAPIMALVGGLIVLNAGLESDPAYYSSEDIMTPIVVGVLAILLSVYLFNVSDVTLSLEGMILTMKKGRFFSRIKQIDLSTVSDVSVAVQHIQYSTRYRLRVTEPSGDSLLLDLLRYSMNDRLLLLPALQSCLKRPGVCQNPQAITKLFNLWYGKHYGTPVLSSIEQLQVEKKLRSTSVFGKIFLVAFIVFIVGGIVLLGISSAQTDARCASLQSSGVSVNATVDTMSISMSKAGGYRNEESIPVTDPSRAQELDFTVIYTTNTGGLYTERINTDYTTKFLEELYAIISNGQLPIRYLPNEPTVVRPALEFAVGAPKELCSE